MITKTLKSGQEVRGDFDKYVFLSARFQIWAKHHHQLTYSESLACLIAEEPDKQKKYYSSIEEADKEAESGFDKLKGINIPIIT